MGYTLNATILYVLGLAVWVAILLVKYLIKKRQFIFANFLKTSLMYFYIIAVLGVTLFPLPIHEISYPFAMNFIPFASIIQIMRDTFLTVALTQILGNIVMFLPFGFLLPFIVKENKLKKCVYSTLIFTIGIELTQYLIGLIVCKCMYRVVDIDDVILNFIGGIIGYLMYKLTIKIVTIYKAKHLIKEEQKEELTV